MLVLFWAVELANSIFQLRFNLAYRFHASLVAKAAATLVPAVQVVLLRFSPVQSTTPGFMALADVIRASAPPPPRRPHPAVDPLQS